MRAINHAGTPAAFLSLQPSVPGSGLAPPLAAPTIPAAAITPVAIRRERRPTALWSSKEGAGDAADNLFARAAKSSADGPSRRREAPLSQRLDNLGSIGIVNGGADEPTTTAMDLLALGTGRNVAIVCNEVPPNLLNDFPATLTNVVSTTQVGALGAVDTMFMLECSTAKIMQDAKYIKPEGRVVIAGSALFEVTEQVNVMQQLRPDVDIYGHAASEFALTSESSAANPVQASYAVAAMLDGQAVMMVRPLRGDDADWISKRTGFAVTPGTAIPAPFFKDGRLDRPSCDLWLASSQTGMKEAIEQLTLLRREGPDVLTQALASGQNVVGDIDSDVSKQRRAQRVPGLLVQPQSGDEQLALLGPTVVFGANGKIGSALLKSLAATGLPLCGIMRKPDSEFLGKFDSPRFNLTVSDKLPNDFTPKTAFITASTGWPKDAAGNIIFDRSLLLAANINILAPIYKNLPREMPLVMVISNPCSEMTYLGWLLRPDLASNLLAHAGTDVTRQMNRVDNPTDTSSYATAGPHSPMQVNWEMRNKPRLSRALLASTDAADAVFVDTSSPSSRIGRIDARIPVLGQTHQSRSRDKNSVTVPTAAAGLFEAVSFTKCLPQSFATPLTQDEATRLSALLAQHNMTMRVSEGIAPALPRDAERKIRWEMLTEAFEEVPLFPQKFSAAMQAMEEGRSALLHALADKINTSRSARNRVEIDWILANRGAALAEALASASASAKK